MGNKEKRIAALELQVKHLLDAHNWLASEVQQLPTLPLQASKVASFAEAVRNHEARLTALEEKA